MRIGYILAPARGTTDETMCNIARHLAACGLKLAGAVQIARPRKDGERPPMTLSILPDGPTISISQSLGEAAEGCALDPGGLEHAVAAALRRREGADVVIINKFGRQEAEGRGFRTLIAEAAAAGQPMIVGLNADYHEAFAAFVADMADPLPPDPLAVEAWLRALTVPA